MWKELGQDDKADSAKNRLSELKQKGPPTRVERLSQPRIVAKSDSANDTAGDVNFGPYMSDIERRVKRAWFPQNGRPERGIQVIFHIQKGGEISNLHLSRSSGKATDDQSAIKAIQNAAPFRPLPPGAGDVEKFEFTFSYQTFSGAGDGAVRRL